MKTNKQLNNLMYNTLIQAKLHLLNVLPKEKGISQQIKMIREITEVIKRVDEFQLLKKNIKKIENKNIPKDIQTEGYFKIICPKKKEKKNG